MKSVRCTDRKHGGDLYVVAEYEDGWVVEKPDYSKPLEDCAFVQVAGPYKRKETAERKAEAFNFIGSHPQ